METASNGDAIDSRFLRIPTQIATKHASGHIAFLSSRHGRYVGGSGAPRRLLADG